MMLRESLLPSSRRCGISASSLLLLFLAVISLTGCGGGERIPPLTPVKGKVLLDGAPLTTGQVSLTPVVPPAEPTPPSSGKIGADGSFEVFTSGKPGAPVGKYKVWISPPTVPLKDGEAPLAIDSKYREAKSTPLLIDVVEKAAAGSYDLKLSK